MNNVILTPYKSVAVKKQKKAVTFPINAKVITAHGKPAVTIPKPVADWYGIASDWSTFDIFLTESGILLVPKRRNEKHLIAAGESTIAETSPAARDGGILNRDSRAPALAIATEARA